MASIICVGLVFIAEWMQPSFGRSRSFDDGLNGLIGIGVAWVCWYVPQFKQARPGRRGALVGLAIFVMAALFNSMTPIYRQIRAFDWQGRHFPMLADFTTAEQFHLWQPQPEQAADPEAISESYRTRRLESPAELIEWKQGALEIRVRPGHDFTGASLLLRGQARDWSAYRTLVLEITSSADGPRLLGIRIDDDGDVSRLTGRYQSALDLQPGLNRLEVPLAAVQSGPRERSLNLRGIRRLALFTGQADPLVHQFAITSVRLQ